MTATWRDEQGSKGERYGYDPANQLRSVSYNADQVWTGTPLNPTRTVTYDANALNRAGPTGVNDNGVGTEFEANGMNQYTVFGGQTPNYDANFNLYQMSGWQYTYDAEKRLVTAVNPSPRAQFTYDGLGRCVKRTIDGVTKLFIYDGWKPAVEADENGAVTAWNVYGAGADEILWRWSPADGHIRYHHDVHGNVEFLLDGTGHGLERYTYDAFGQPTITDWNGNVRSQSAFGNRFMFQGREYLSELGLYDYRNRFYQPALGRFLQADPIGFGGGDMNLFRYCAGDPVNRSDPSGLQGLPLEDPGFYDVGPEDGNKSLEEINRDRALNAGANIRILLQGIFNALFGPSAGPYYTPPLGSNANVPPGQAIPTAPPPPVWPSNTPPPPQPLPPPRLPREPGIWPADPTGNVGNAGAGGESRVSQDNGSFSAFSPNGNSFTTAEGNSAFNFFVDLTSAGQQAYFAAPTGNPAGGGLHPDSISKPRYPAGQKKH